MDSIVEVKNTIDIVLDSLPKTREIINMGFGDFTNIILAAALLIFGLRDIAINTIDKDFSKSKYLIIRWFLAKKEQVTARHILRELKLKPEELRPIIYEEQPHNHRGAIHFLSKCIVKAEGDAKYSYGNDGRHQSSYYVDSIGYTQNEKNSIVLCKIMKHLINKVDSEYHYVFSIKGGNIPLAAMFASENRILSITAKDRNEIVDSGNDKDIFINYEGFGNLVEEANGNEHIKRKGIAIACNLAEGSVFLDAITKYNERIEVLKTSGVIPANIEKIKNVYILYRAIKGGNLDAEYTRANLECYRYFDLDDASKECLYLIHNKDKHIDDFLCYECIKRGKNRCCAKHCYKTL
jgi:hypothetical protein